MKLYVLVREDLGKSYGAVQAGHAVAEWVKKHGAQGHWPHEILVYLSVPDELTLSSWVRDMKALGLEHAAFFEPDIGNQMTAVACLTDSKIFKRLKLF